MKGRHIFWAQFYCFALILRTLLLVSVFFTNNVCCASSILKYSFAIIFVYSIATVLFEVAFLLRVTLVASLNILC